MCETGEFALSRPVLSQTNRGEALRRRGSNQVGKTKLRLFAKALGTAAVVVAIAVAVTTDSPLLTPAGATGVDRRRKAAFCQAVPGSCTIFAVSHGDQVLFGNNEDWVDPNTYIWLIPSDGKSYSTVCLGFDDRIPQGGINERGLAFDFNALPEAPLNPHPELPSPEGNIVTALISRCASVEQAIELAKSYNWGSSIRWQLLLADATGDAAVMSAGPDGELAFTRKPPGDGYLVSTNFNRANPSNGSYPCWRYNRASAMLAHIETGDADLLDYLVSVLDAVHQEGSTVFTVNTVYSNVFDLRNGTIHLYQWHNFDEVVTLNVAEEVARGKWSSRIRDLFTARTVGESAAEYTRHQGGVWVDVARAWLPLTAVSIIVLLFDLVRGAQPPIGTQLAWVLIAATFGPLGLLGYVLSYRQWRSTQPQPATVNWRRALGATLFCVSGYALAWLVIALFIILALPHAEPTVVVPLLYLASMLIGLLVFRGPAVATRQNSSYAAAIRRAAATEVISTNLAFAGMLPTAMALQDSWFANGIRINNPMFWLLVSLAAIAATVCVYPLHLWMARRGFGGLPGWLPTRGEDGSPLPSVSGVWPVLLLSVALVAVSLAGTIILLS